MASIHRITPADRPSAETTNPVPDKADSASTDTQALIAAARAGDKAAVERLLVTFQPDARRIAYTQCASVADAEDAAQESLLVIYQRIGALRAIGSFSSWMFSIVRHECHRLIRKLRRQTDPIDVGTQFLAYHSTPELHSDLAAAIQSLPDKYREAIMLRDFHEYSIQEIAEQTRLTRAAVKSRIHRGREMIREYLIDYR